jgi:Abhydrolase family
MPVPDFQARLLAGLGGDWPDPCPLNVRHRAIVQKSGYRIESIYYDAEPNDPIPALLLIPDGVTAQNPAPAIAVWHQHNGEWRVGKSEPAGLFAPGDASVRPADGTALAQPDGAPYMHHTGVALVQAGYVVLCPDALCFEERQDPTGTLTGGDFERFEFLRYLVHGKCMAWKNILDMRRAVDLLVSRPDVRADRIGCYGHSMGSTHAWMVGPWEPRLACVVGNCCLPTYAAIHHARILHCFPNFVPGVFQWGDTPDIAALIAPRPLLLNFGELDLGSLVAFVREGIRTIAAAYASRRAEENFSAFIEPGVGHVLSDAMWIRARDWFARHLKSPQTVE